MSKVLSKKLMDLFDEINKSNKLKLVGSQSIIEAEYALLPKTIPTNILSIDKIIGLDGIPRGKLTQLYGLPSSGKTTLALHIAAAAQQAGLTVMFYDFELTYDSLYAAALGVDNDALIYAKPHPDHGGEGALENILDILRTGEIDLLILDSIAAVTPAKRLASDVGKVLPAIQARLIAEYIQRITPVIGHVNTAFLCINQLTSTMKTDMYGNPILTPRGGYALEYASTLNMRLTASKRANEKEGEPETKDVKVVVDKNKVGNPHQTTDLTLRFGVGFDPIADVVNHAPDFGIIVQKGGGFFELLINGEMQKIRGKENVIELLENNMDVFFDIQRATKKALYENLENRRTENAETRKNQLAAFQNNLAASKQNQILKALKES